MVVRPTQIDNGPPPTGKNQWSYEQRVCLDLLSTHERNLSRAKRVQAFNNIYKDHLTACGIPPPGLKASTIDCQYGERRLTEKSSWQATWGDVCKPPGTAIDQALRERLRRDIAVALGDDEGEAIEVAGPSGPRTPPPTAMRPQQRDCINERVVPAEDPYARVYATPSSSSRKRPAVTLPTTPIESNMFYEDTTRDDDDNNDNNDDYDDEYVPRAKRKKARSPTVWVPPSPENLEDLIVQSRSTLSTPSKRSSGPRQGATMRLIRLSGPPIWLTPAEYAEAMEPLEDVSEEAAHPTPPALLYRVHSAKSHGINSNEGFVAGRFTNILIEPRGPPDAKNVEWNDVGHHLNNGGHDQLAPPSPFISTSNHLVWAIRKALKEGDPNAFISVIDTSQMDSKSIYHVLPFYNQLKKKRVFYKGGFNYRGSHEHIVWHKIPGAAIIKTFSVADLIALSESKRGIRNVLRLDQLSTAKTSATEIIKQFRQNAVQINGRVATAIGRIAIFMGLDHNSSAAQLSRVVYEIAQGLALQANGESQDSVGGFVQAFVKASSDTYIDLSDHVKLKHAFLHGIEQSCGDLNMHLKGPEEFRLMKSRASRRGLADAGSIISRGLSRAMRDVTRFTQEQERAQLGPVAGRLALENCDDDVVADDDDDDDDDVVANGLDHLDLDEYIHYE